METLLGGRYAIERRIGEGGMAEVLLARDLAEDGRPVVVKRCRAHLKHQPEFAHLFLREARLASLVHHPNVVSLEATGDDEGQPYLVMEYLQGFTVRDVFFRAATEGGIPQDIAAAIILGAARGLSAAHTAVDEQGQPIGLVHRDVSPHNLFLTDHGVVKVLDFGIAKGASDVTMTRAGHVKGKASYLSPEQLVSGGAVDQRADLFSLGIIAWELFTGARLFKRASETDTINAIRSLNVDSPTKHRPALDAEYSRVVMMQLARKPDDRPRDAATIALALERALRRRMPGLVGPTGDAELAKYVAHIRQVAPVEEGTPSLIPPTPDPLL
ncbi:MAG: serine/threonine-protein kinase, partial [Polyangiales bacterium]